MNLYNICEEFFNQINPQFYEEDSPSIIQTMDRSLDHKSEKNLDESIDRLFVFNYIFDKLLKLEEYFKKKN